MSITIRKAKREDAPFLAKMILQSSRADKKIGFFDYIFDDSNDDEILEKLKNITLNDTQSYLRYDNFLVAEVDKKPVGTLCSYEPRVATREKFIQALKDVGAKDDISDKFKVLDECKFDINNRTLLFDILEEVEGYVDVGILKALMQKSLLSARLKGYRIAQTIVEIGSLETLMFYEKLNFKVKEEKKCELYKELFGRVGLMLLELEF
jgi:hypothetical protein